MLVSVFTPSHNARYLNECYASLVSQSFGEWEWIVLLNRGAKDWRPPATDERVKVARDATVRGVGAAKRAACDLATGEILVELDHDDLLAPTCLEEVHQAFVDNEGAVLVYSDCAQVTADLERDETTFNLEMGWEYRDVDVAGKAYLACSSMAPYPHNVGYIWYAPNHVRAFRRSAYEAVGGYDASLSILDDQELMMRLYLAGDFHHIDKCLYLQRMHGRNTQSEARTNASIQDQTVILYEEHIGALYSAWSKRNGLSCVSLSCATSPEMQDGDAQSVVIDPEDPRIPLPDSSVGLITAFELLQRVPARAAFFNECYRVLDHGGLLMSLTPSTDGRGAFQDPSHVAFYNENSFWYLTQTRLQRSIPELRARLQMSHIRSFYPTEWDRENAIVYVQANLLAVKDGPRLGGALLS